MKILLIRFSSIGDIVLTTPVARCLKQQLDAEVHFITKRAFAPVLEPNPHVDRVFSFEKKLSETLPALHRERYDWVLDLHHNLRSARVKWSLGRPARSFDKLNLEKWLLVHTGIDRLPDRHIVHRYMATAEHLGVRYDGQGLDYFIPESEEVDVRGFAPGLMPGAYVAFAIGANHATKRMPEEKIADVCRRIPSPVLLLGGKSEQAAGARIAATAGAHVHDLCGRLSLHQSASVLRQSARVATHDTGLMHMAAALRKPIVSLWGNTVPKFGMYPFYPDGMLADTTFEVTGLPCRPCSKIGYDRCPKGHFRCMNDLDTAAVAEALK
ncbi:MAG: glycosyltransferase family 9 protein [Saprospiraceae bacterium]|jgi:ADP-heptose:LPS heptosyltransferase|nr:glycosyltransferase family 9 protein [Saprospiraceae bacterium]